MPKPLEGVQVLEFADGQLARSCGALLADWGADVITIPVPPSMRFALGTAPSLSNHLDRGKRSILIHVDRAEGWDLLHSLASSSDVFLTSLTSRQREELGVDVAHVRADNAQIIYARASGLGPRGEERDHAAVDHSAYWARGGVAETFRKLHQDLEAPLVQPRGFGELASGGVLAGGIATALVRRSLHGEASIVDVSLLGFAVWHLYGEVVSAVGHPQPASRADAKAAGRLDSPNPFVNIFRTADGRYLALCVLQSERYMGDVFERLGRSDVLSDKRFDSVDKRAANRRALIEVLDNVFASQTLAEWRERLRGTEWVWEPVQDLSEALRDEQVLQNHAIVRPANGDDRDRVIAGPVQFDGSALVTNRAPLLGEHTDTILAQLGLGGDRIDALRRSGALGS